MKLLLLLAFAATCNALFEDQVGKWDWRVQSLGCPVDMALDSATSDRDQLLMLTESSVVASISTNTGQIDWRQINEEATQFVDSFMTANKNDVLISVNGGEYLRLFDKVSGSLTWQHLLRVKNLKRQHIVLKRGFVGVLTQARLAGLGKKGASMWQVKLDDKIDWLGILTVGDYVAVFGKAPNGDLHIEQHSIADGSKLFMATDTAAFKDLDPKLCAISGATFACTKSRTVHSIHFLATAATTAQVELAQDGEPSEIAAMEVADAFGVRHGKWLSVLRADETRLAHFTTDWGVVATGAHYTVVYLEATHKLRIFDRTNGVKVAEVSLSADATGATGAVAAVKRMRVLEYEGGRVLQLLIVRVDCRVDAIEVHRDERSATIQWSRFEGLGSISAVEMIDLPLSDSQATIKTEFSQQNAPIWKNFLLRVHGQTEQLRRSFTKLANQLVHAFELLSSGRESLSNVLLVLMGEAKRPTTRPRAGSPQAEAKVALPMERDNFNLRKLILATTRAGSVYALHSDYGVVVWSLYLGSQFEPLTTHFGTPTVPLFVQRSTAYYKYDSQAAVAFKLKGTAKTRIVLFNPTNGQTAGSHTLENVKHLELAPSATRDFLHPLIIINAANKVTYLPSAQLDAGSSPQWPHHYTIDLASGHMSGFAIERDGGSLQPTWSTKLNFSPDERVVKVATKRHSERVHSQGKVLGDRNVLYKYANPNLIAIASVDKVHSTFTLHLVDAVSGAVRYTAKHERATTPVHLVICENWVMVSVLLLVHGHENSALQYTHWSEKARRTEIGILEAYEGLNQTNAKNFNSFTALKEPLSVVGNSYVFPQGISAIAASETEQGLTTRSVVIAMPFGGILELSRRILDPRRTMEMTPELREEMVIPYMPEIPIATEDLINYNQTVSRITEIKTAASGLESTSLMFAYGLDLFFTRLTPSGTFDVLKDDFDYVLISIVLFTLVAASLIFRRIARYQSLKQAWA